MKTCAYVYNVANFTRAS